MERFDILVGMMKAATDEYEKDEAGADAIAKISAVIGYACIEIARELAKQNERWGKMTRDE